jgi:SAM-dependent methyltransferase
VTDQHKHPASFRDPNGFLFTHENQLYRQVNQSYRDNYEHLVASGLYKDLVSKGWLVPHDEKDPTLWGDEQAYKIIQPRLIDFISYPYEWSFSQLKDAALLTLSIQKMSIKYGMSLKDSSAYNIQFDLGTGKPVLIDTLSFEILPEGKPWVAYRQFCQHFLAPLALMAYKDIRLGQLLRIYIDGIPLDFTSSLLPLKTRLNFGLMTHLHLHAAAQKRFAGTPTHTSDNTRQMNKTALMGLVDSLNRTVQKITWQPIDTDWGEYYDHTNYSPESMDEKAGIVSNLLDLASPKSIWDLGANTGRFSRIALQKGSTIISFDIDPAAVELNYHQLKKDGEIRLLPLLLDLTNPSPGLGWANCERDSLRDRTKPDLILALALIHHLAITNNLPLSLISSYFKDLAPWLIIEFVPKTDSQVQRLLVSREDIFKQYTQNDFEDTFTQHFNIHKKQPIQGSQRCIYLLERK